MIENSYSKTHTLQARLYLVIPASYTGRLARVLCPIHIPGEHRAVAMAAISCAAFRSSWVSDWDGGRPVSWSGEDPNVVPLDCTVCHMVRTRETWRRAVEAVGECSTIDLQV